MRSLLVGILLLLSSGLSFAEQWELARRDDERDIRVYLRAMPGSSYKAFYATTRVQASLSSIVAVLSDVPAMPEWIARMKAARLINRDADREIWIHGIYRLPYPFLEREAVLHATLKQEKNGAVEVVTRTEKGIVQRHPKRVQITNMQSIWRLTPEQDGMVKIEIWGQGDPGGYVPPLLFNYNLPDEPVQTFKNLRQMLMREKYRGKSLEYIRDAER